MEAVVQLIPTKHGGHLPASWWCVGVVELLVLLLPQPCKQCWRGQQIG